MRPKDKVVLNYPILEFRLIKAVEKRDGIEVGLLQGLHR